MTLRRLLAMQAGVLGLAVVVAILLGLALFALLVFAPGPDVSTYQSAVDDLETPTNWEVERATVEAPGTFDGCIRWLNLNCPSVTRYYLVGGEPIAAFEDAQRIVTEAGFRIDREFDPRCDSPPSGPLCALHASRGEVFLQLNVNRPGGGDDGLGFEEPGRFIIRVIARQIIAPLPTN